MASLVVEWWSTLMPDAGDADIPDFYAQMRTSALTKAFQAIAR
jgi:hypothetical protein